RGARRVRGRRDRGLVHDARGTRDRSRGARVLVGPDLLRPAPPGVARSGGGALPGRSPGGGGDEGAPPRGGGGVEGRRAADELGRGSADAASPQLQRWRSARSLPSPSTQ